MWSLNRSAYSLIVFLLATTPPASTRQIYIPAFDKTGAGMSKVTNRNFSRLHTDRTRLVVGCFEELGAIL